MRSYEFPTTTDSKIIKQDFLRGLGASSDAELMQNLEQAFLGDGFQENVVNIFKRFYQESLQENPQSSFLDALKEWNKEKLEQNFDERFAISVGNSAGLLGAFLLNFFLTPIAGIACAVGVTSASSIAESQAKRNIGNIGHLSSHFANKLQSALKGLKKDFEEEFGSATKFSNHETKDKSGIYRIMSYFSGALLSATEKSFSRFSSLSESVNFAITAVVGSIVPILPLLNYKLAKKSANLRQDRLENVIEELTNTVEEICKEASKESVKASGGEEKLKKIFKKFAQNLKSTDSHGRIVSAEKPNKDKITNPSKIITFGSWSLSKIRKPIKKFTGYARSCFGEKNTQNVSTDDLTILPQEFIASTQTYSSYEEKTVEEFSKTTSPEDSSIYHHEIEIIKTQIDDVVKGYKPQHQQAPLNYEMELIPLKTALKPIYSNGESPLEINQKKQLELNRLEAQKKFEQEQAKAQKKIDDENKIRRVINATLPSYWILKNKFDLNINQKDKNYLKEIKSDGIDKPSTTVHPISLDAIVPKNSNKILFWG